MGYLSAYGLNIFSDFDFGILELIRAEKSKEMAQDINLNISLSNSEPQIPKKPNEDYCPFTFNDFFVFWEDIGTFRILNGKEIEVFPQKNVSPTTLKSYIMGPVIASLLQQRGFLVFHASAVKIDNFAVAFLGFSGMGKSTLAMALNKKGYPLITDDILAIKTDENGLPIVFSGLPHTKLSPQALFSIYGMQGNISVMSPGPEERFSCLTSSFSKKPLPLKIAYAMKNSPNSKITPLNSQNALMELLNHSYFSNQFQEEDKALNLTQCSNVFKHITIRSLEINKSLEKLPEIVKMIEEDISHDFEQPVKSSSRS